MIDRGDITRIYNMTTRKLPCLNVGNGLESPYTQRHKYYIWVQVKIGGPEQAPGPHPFHTPVPYPRSIPPWRIRSIPLFHTSDPYVMIYMYICIYIYIYVFISIYIYTHLNMCSLILHLYAHTWAHIHTWVCTCKNRFTMPKPCDCVGKSVPAAFVVWW